MLGGRGPCEAGQTLQLVRGRPQCGPGAGGECHQSWQVSVEGECYDLLSPGPCKPGHWVVLHSPTLTGRCEAVPCPGPGEVWRADQCSCLGQEEASQVCGQHAGLVWSPTADGVCVCHDGYYADDTGVCHPLGSRGPCREGLSWLLDDSQRTAHCGQSEVQVGLVELVEKVASKNNNDSSSTAQAVGCFIDANGKCRKTINRGDFGEEDEAERFLEWLGGFSEKPSDCWPVMECEGKEGTEGVTWSDGECYPLASTGPCQPGHWLVLGDSHGPGYSLKCQARDCPEEEVWWSPDCTCFPPTLNQTARPKSGLESPCGDGQMLLVSPYGYGVCAFTENALRLFEQLTSTSSRTSEAATRKNCFLDENGMCRKTLNIRGTIINRIKPETDLLTWLDQFPKPR